MGKNSTRYSSRNQSSNSALVSKYGEATETDKPRTSTIVNNRCLEWRSIVALVLVHPIFDTTIGFVVVLNAIVVGIEQKLRLEDKHEHMTIIRHAENIFLTIYLVELLLRLYAYGVSCLRDNFIKFDGFLVVLSIAIEWVAVLASGGQLMILRVARLARLTRSLRLIIKFRNLWLLLQGLVASLNTLVYTTVLIAVMLSIFGTVGVELITLRYRDFVETDPESVDPNVWPIIDRHFSSLTLAMLTLIQFICMDDVSIIYWPLVTNDWLLAIYFFLVIVVLAIVLMNIITAIIVNGALEKTASDKEARRVLVEKSKRSLLKALKAMFLRLDDDGSGYVEKEEIFNMSGTDRDMLNDFMNAVADPFEIFDMLDINGCGSVDVDEFCEGLYQAATSNVPLELRRIEKLVNSLDSFIHHFADSIKCSLGAIEERVSSTSAEDGQSWKIEAKECSTPDRLVSPYSEWGTQSPSGAATPKSQKRKQSEDAASQRKESLDSDDKAHATNGPLPDRPAPLTKAHVSTSPSTNVNTFSRLEEEEFIRLMKHDLEASIYKNRNATLLEKGYQIPMPLQSPRRCEASLQIPEPNSGMPDPVPVAL